MGEFRVRTHERVNELEALECTGLLFDALPRSDQSRGEAQTLLRRSRMTFKTLLDCCGTHATVEVVAVAVPHFAPQHFVFDDLEGLNTVLNWSTHVRCSTSARARIAASSRSPDLRPC